jgi:hypothetical protein
LTSFLEKSGWCEFFKTVHNILLWAPPRPRACKSGRNNVGVSDRRTQDLRRLSFELERGDVPARRAEEPPVFAAELRRALVPNPECEDGNGCVRGRVARRTRGLLRLCRQSHHGGGIRGQERRLAVADGRVHQSGRRGTSATAGIAPECGGSPLLHSGGRPVRRRRVTGLRHAHRGTGSRPEPRRAFGRRAHLARRIHRGRNHPGVSPRPGATPFTFGTPRPAGFAARRFARS